MVYKGLSVVFPLVTAAYTARVLLPSGVGIVSYSQVVVNYFVLLASLGIPNYGIKAIAQADNVSERSKTFIELLTINIISTVCFSAVFYLIINNVSYFGDKRIILNIMGSVIVLNVFQIDWFYQGIEEYKFIATRSIIIKLISLLLMFIFVRNSDDLWKYAIVLSIASAGNNICNAIHAKRYIEFRRYYFDLRSHLKPVLILLASTVATEIYTMLDTVMLEYFHGDAVVGYYSNSVRIVRTVYVLVSALIAPFFPRISLLIKSRETVKINSIMSIGTMLFGLIALPCSIGLFTTADYIIPMFFGELFENSIVTLRILAPLVTVFTIAYFLGHIILMATGNESTILKASICGAIVNFISNMLLIPSLKQNGAAIASVMAEVLVTIIILKKSNKFYKISIDKGYYRSILISIMILVLFIVLFRYCIEDMSSISGISIIVLSAFFYFFALIITRNPMMCYIKDKYLRRR